MAVAASLSPATHSAADVVAALGLEPLDQEGGYFRRTAESGLFVRPEDGTEPRRAYSVIFALFAPAAFSAMHRLNTDEVWCWHAGDVLESLRLYPDGRGERVRLGADLAAGERLQDVIAAGAWQGTRLAPGGRWSLVTCVVAPEFQWGDFELAERDALVRDYPAWSEGITGLTRGEPAAGNR